MNESKLLKNPNKCPMITINLNEKKINAKISHNSVTCPNPTFEKHWASSNDSILKQAYYKSDWKGTEKSQFLPQILRISICTLK